jgi:hypothetical protein
MLKVYVLLSCLQPAMGAKGVGIHTLFKLLNWTTPLGPLRRELYQLVRVPEDSLFKFKVRMWFLLWAFFSGCFGDG